VGNPPETTCLTTLIIHKNTMEIPPLHMNITLNQEGNGAIFHINCQSDGERTKWKEDKEEAGENALGDWLNTLGCLLKIHGTTDCQWPYSSVEPDTNLLLAPDMFSDPWVYSISNFPKNYKLFTLERKRVGDSPPKKDHYLYGMFLSFFCVQPDQLFLFQVGRIDTGPPKSIIHICIGYSIMLEGSLIPASANTVITTETKRKSMKSFPYPHTHIRKALPKGLQDPRSTSKQRSRIPGMLQV
jgi:hypothetical protein